MTFIRRAMKVLMWGLLILLLTVVGGHYYWSQPKTDYPVINITIQTRLADKVKETSSLALLNGQIWTTNDSGDRANLYQINALTGLVVKQVNIAGVGSYDWEALAQDENKLYVIDCGNNKGTRKSRSIISVESLALLAAEDGGKLAASGVDRFTMADKPQQSLTMFFHDYDCEAATVVGDQLWIFSKNWVDFKSRRYSLDLVNLTGNVSALTSLPELPPVQALEPQQELDVAGLITAADFNAVTGQLALLGYSENLIYKQPFIWLVPVQDKQVDWQQARRFNLAPYGQWESIAWRGDHELLVTAEAAWGDAGRFGVVELGLFTTLD
ncbi:MAG: hypothetical protein ACI86X_002078 [Moritella sp.]|jgi:hypothetical protein